MNEDNFFPVDRLWAIGLSMAVAQQMVRAMNYTMTHSYMPGTITPPTLMHTTTPISYYAMIDGERMGPLSIEHLLQLISDKKIDGSTYVWRAGMPSWKVTSEIPELAHLVSMTPPPFDPKSE